MTIAVDWDIKQHNKHFGNTIRVSNSLDPDQAQCFVGPDLDPNCLQKFSADNTRRQRFKLYFQIQLVGPIGPDVLELLPSSIKVPSSSVIKKDEVHLIMEVSYY